MIIEHPIRRIKKLENLPRDEVLHAQQVVKQGGRLPKHVIEKELARFLRVQRHANYW